jgi:hypothetical protein
MEMELGVGEASGGGLSMGGKGERLKIPKRDEEE